MARNRTVNYAVVNIQLVRKNSTVESYIKLFEELSQNPREILLERNNYLKTRSIKPLNEDNLSHGFSGEIFKSNGLTSDWYDEEKDERNRNKNLGESFIPPNFKANPRFFKFIFFPLHQKLVCEIKDPDNYIQPSLIEKFLNKFIVTEKLQEKYGKISINLVPEVITAEKIINCKTLKRIQICIEKCDDDISTDLNKNIFSRMMETNADTYIETYISGKNKFLTLKKETQQLVKVAIDHGIIEYKMENLEGLVEDKSTTETNPLIVRIQYDPDVTDQHYLIQSKALDIVNNIK